MFVPEMPRASIIDPGTNQKLMIFSIISIFLTKHLDKKCPGDLSRNYGMNALTMH
jgi:hypothetical protein